LINKVLRQIPEEDLISENYENPVSEYNNPAISLINVAAT
jgi:hypothetical protein